MERIRRDTIMGVSHVRGLENTPRTSNLPNLQPLGSQHLAKISARFGPDNLDSEAKAKELQLTRKAA